jgi:DNA helicase MCM9
VIRAGLIKMLESERVYECAKCKHTFKVFSDTSMQQCTLTPPTSCPSVRANPCKGTSFTVVEGSRVCRDYQEIKIQEQIQTLEVRPQTQTPRLSGDQDPGADTDPGGKALNPNP